MARWARVPVGRLLEGRGIVVVGLAAAGAALGLGLDGRGGLGLGGRGGFSAMARARFLVIVPTVRADAGAGRREGWE